MPNEENTNMVDPSLISDAIDGVEWLIDSVIGNHNDNDDRKISTDLRAYEISSLNPNHHKHSLSSKKGDVSLNDYLFDDNNQYANNNSGVEIDGFLFFPESVKGDESFARREFKRTKIMSGGEFVTRGQYIPKEFSFTTTLDIDPNQPFMYDKIFAIMENKPCEVISPYMGDNFKAEIQIDKTHPKASPSSLKLDIKVKEIVSPNTTVIGDALLQYPSSTTLSDKAISVKTVEKPQVDEAKLEREQITYDLKAKDKTGRVFDNPYK